jgi:hypothetical protein
MRSALIMACVALSPFLAIMAAQPAQAQSTAPSQSRDANVLRACKTESRAYCPRDDGAPSRSGRNTAICLKSMRSSLSPPCRRAVKSMFP